jgi:hypothetical protein
MARDGRVEAQIRRADLTNVGSSLLAYARREQWPVKYWGHARKMLIAGRRGRNRATRRTHVTVAFRRHEARHLAYVLITYASSIADQQASRDGGASQNLELLAGCWRMGAALGVAQDQPRGRKCLTERQVADRMHRVSRLDESCPEGGDEDMLRILGAQDVAAEIDRVLEGKNYLG